MWRPRVNVHLRAAVALCLTLLGAQAQSWERWSPREETKPVYAEGATPDELVLAGGGNPAVYGGWVKRVGGIQEKQWYRLEVQYRPEHVEYESLHVPIRLDWLKADGRRAGQPEYAWRVTRASQWRSVKLEAPAPEGAVAVRVQLLLQNAPDAKVTWRNMSLTPVDAPAPRTVRVATIRYHPKGPDPVTKFTTLVRESVERGTDVILLPEGITLVGTGKTYADVAEPVPGPTTAKLGELAAERKAWIVAGILERSGREIYNTAVLVDRNGKLAGKYRKVYLPREELEGGVTPGREYPVFQTDFGTVGMLICWDVQYADAARALALRGAELLLMPIWGGNETLAKARAIENRVFLASSGYDFPSLIYDPDGETLVRSEKDGTVVSTVIDLNRRYADPWLGDMRGRFFQELRGDVAVEPPGRR